MEVESENNDESINVISIKLDKLSTSTEMKNVAVESKTVATFDKKEITLESNKNESINDARTLKF